MLVRLLDQVRSCLSMLIRMPGMKSALEALPIHVAICASKVASQNHGKSKNSAISGKLPPLHSPMYTNQSVGLAVINSKRLDKKERIKQIMMKNKICEESVA